MSLNRKGLNLLNKLSKEIASEIVMKRRDPGYEQYLDKDECVSKLSIVVGLPEPEITKLMDERISEYLKTPHMF